MDAKDFVTLVLLAAEGEIRGNTKLQKMVYLLGLMTNSMDDLGYRPHFYGPYSDGVAGAITELKTIGAVDQNITDWGCNRSGFEIKRYDYRLNEPGRRYAQGVADRNKELWDKLRSTYEIYRQRGDDKDYMSLSIAAKAYFLLDKNKAPATDAELARLASRFGWSVSTGQVKEAVDYLAGLGLVQRVNK